MTILENPIPNFLNMVLHTDERMDERISTYNIFFGGYLRKGDERERGGYDNNCKTNATNWAPYNDLCSIILIFHIIFQL